MKAAASKSDHPEYTRGMVEFLCALRPGDLPKKVLDRARYFLLDYLSVAIRGSREESARCAQRMIQRMGPNAAANNCATVIGTSIRALPGYAAFANGASAHSIELDDTHSGGSIHLGTVMYPVALALAETMPGLALDDFLTAVVCGYEAASRTAMAAQPQELYALGFHPTPVCGVFGAAMTASRLLGLTAEQALAAFGIAGSMAAGSMEFLAEGSWTKRIHPGLAARNGMEAAFLAAEGFSAPRRILEGRDGFLRAYSRSPIRERLTERLGKSYEILHTAVKPHACCRYMQGPIDAVLELMRQHSIQPGKIKQIEVAVLEAGWEIIVEPRAQKYHPETIVDAQFSMPFGAAVAALYGAAGLDQFTLEQIGSPQVRQMMGRVVATKDLRLEKDYPRQWPARAAIRLSSGEEFEASVRYPKGDPQNPLSWEEMAEKFRALAGGALGAGRCEEVIRQVSTAKPSALPALCCA